MSARLDNLKTVRIAAGFSITELARRSNTSDQIINTLESKGTNGQDRGGAADYGTIDRIIAALGSDRATCGFADLK